MANKPEDHPIIDSGTEPESWIKIAAFVFLSYAFSWIVWWPILDVLAAFDGDPGSIPPVYFAWLALGATGPSVSAVLIVGFFEGRSGLNKLFSRITIWRVHWGWYCFALLIVPLADLISRILYSASEPSAILVDLGKVSALILVVPFALVSGALTEELGWRGFMQPALRKRLGVFSTGSLIGLVWAFWHTPLFFAKVGSFVSGTGPTPSSVMSYVLLSVILSWCMAWLGENTKQSVFLAYLFHVSINLAIGAFLLAPADPVTQSNLMLWSGALVLIAFFCVRMLHSRQAGALR